MSARRAFSPWLLLPIWVAGSSLAGLVIGLAVGLFNPGGVETPILIISVLFGNVVGLTAMFCASILHPRLRAIRPSLRVALLALALSSGSVAGSVAVLTFYPLFVLREPRQAIAVVAINGVLALIVGGVTYAYEGLRLRLQDSLREVEEVRLVEARLREEAARSELAALQARINPHFFFNTLNTILSLLDDDPERAQEVVQSLADLFRYTFKVADAGPVMLVSSPLLEGILVVSRFRLDSLSDERNLVYRTNEDSPELHQYTYRRWADPPSTMLQAEIASYLASAGVARDVVTPDIRVDTAYALDGRVLRFESVLGDTAEVRLGLELGVTERDDQKLLFLARYSAARHFPVSDFDAMARAYSDALEEVLQRFMGDWLESRAQ